MICLLLVCAASISAQSLIGQWEAKVDSTNMNMTVELQIKDKENMAFIVNAAVHEEDAMDLVFHISVNGTYTRKKDIINMKLDGESIEAKIDDIKFYGEAADLANNNPETAQFVKKMMETQIDQSKGDMIKDLPTDSDMQILELTQTTLKLKSLDEEDEDDILEFTRK